MGGFANALIDDLPGHDHLTSIVSQLKSGSFSLPTGDTISGGLGGAVCYANGALNEVKDILLAPIRNVMAGLPGKIDLKGASAVSSLATRGDLSPEQQVKALISTQIVASAIAVLATTLSNIAAALESSLNNLVSVLPIEIQAGGGVAAGAAAGVVVNVLSLSAIVQTVISTICGAINVIVNVIASVAKFVLQLYETAHSLKLFNL